jgi:antitoxin (DNA-binding transcriptional repressor) of toxin-antitoxin stability system
MASVAFSATVMHMARDVSIRELRNSTSAVVSELEAGERLTLTVNRRPVAGSSPISRSATPGFPSPSYGESRAKRRPTPAFWMTSLRSATPSSTTFEQGDCRHLDVRCSRDRS